MNIFEDDIIGSPNIFTGDITTIYPPDEVEEGPLFSRLTPEFGSTEPVFGED